MSAPGAYEAPVFRIRKFVPDERRNTGALSQLGRTLDRLCLEAADPFEIAAHLEALGYNNPSVTARYGVADHFELARELFYRTPRRLKLRRPKTALRRPYARQAVMVLTLFVTAAVGMVAGVAAWGPVVWLLVWSQLGGGLLNRAKGELAAPEQARVLSLVVLLGLAGLGALWLLSPFGLGSLCVSLVWLGVAGLLWAERLRLAAALPALVGVLLALTLVPRVSAVVPLALAALLSLGLLVPLLRRLPGRCLRWAVLQGRHIWPFMLYGLGQSCLLLALLRGAGPEALPGVLLFALVLLASEGHLLVLRGRLNDYLWRGESAAGYARFAREALTRYAGGYLLALLPALAILALPGPVGERWLFHLAGFALFGLVLGLALVWLSLGESVLPALVFAAGGALVAAGVPFLAVAGVMALAEFAALLRRGPALGRYGVFLV